MDLAGQRILVVGASSGLGRAAAIGLARAGGRVALAARRGELTEAAAAEAGNGAIGLACDVCDPGSCETAVKATVEAFGGLDAVVFTAALGTLGRLEDTDDEVWRRAFSVNVTGASLITRAAMPHLEAVRGTVVYFSSMAGSFSDPWPGLGVYAATKAALERMVESWELEHPTVRFTRFVVGPSIGDESSPSQFVREFDPEVAMALMPQWSEMDRFGTNLVTPDDITQTLTAILSIKAAIPYMVILPPS
jgi:NAD(P)-dependent dehydrogenase (short-subunit alcohol dehydrogenase family)